MKRAAIIVLSLAAIPVLFFLCIFGAFAFSNFPFTSNVVAQASTPGGDGICVVQTFKGAEPYQVSYYARRAGGPWVWHYLAHEDDRWRSCKIEVSGDTLRIYCGTNLRETASIAAATAPPLDLQKQLPRDFSATQILAYHVSHYRR